VHDFLITELGRAVPYGVYDLAANACKRRYDSTGYQKILPMRLDNSTGRAFIDAGIVESRLSRQSPTYSRIRGSTYCLGAVKHYPGNA
jgi:hypothetical protein